MARKAVLLDSNLLVLYVVGAASPDYIRRESRLSAYHAHGHAAFGALSEMIATASSLLVTPNILTEVSNLLGRRSGDREADTAVIDAFRHVIHGAKERVAPSTAAMRRDEFGRLGLADAATLHVLDRASILLTDDRPLWLAAWKAGYEAQTLQDILEARRPA